MMEWEVRILNNQEKADKFAEVSAKYKDVAVEKFTISSILALSLALTEGKDEEFNKFIDILEKLANVSK